MPLPSFVVSMKARWVANGLPDYPLWIAALIDSAALGTAVVALVQHRHDGPMLALILLALALVPWVAELWGQRRVWWLFVVLTGGSLAVLMSVHPVQYDFAPALLALAAGHATAVAGFWRGFVVMLAGDAVVVVAGLQGAMAGPEVAIWAAAIAGGLDLGFVVRSLQIRLDAQAREHAASERQAVLEERQRIARDVHDLVAHSLSVTMLHLTAARAEVEDAATHRDRAGLDEAVEALREAERVGRRAMTDIRSTVGLLGRDGAAATTPTPGLADLAGLVDDFRRAGLTVAYSVTGEVDDVPQSTAVGLYRIVQESLANVAKHAPGARAEVRLELEGDPGRLVVASDLAGGAAGVAGAIGRDSGGSGLKGMAARAQQLGADFTAGGEGRQWVVRVSLPRGDQAAGHLCPLPRLTAPFRRTVPGPA